MLVNGCYKKCYNVVLEYLNINIISDNLDLENKKIYLDEKIELIPINITHLYNNITKKTGEIFLIMLTNILGIISLINSNDWIMTIISWELFNYTLYLLVSINSYSEKSISSSLKYFILSWKGLF